MKFIYNGPYANFNGYVFAFGKPTEVTDRATQAALMKKPGFRKVDDEEKAPEAAPAPVLKRPVLTVPRRR